jgi:hypothetical protein
LVEAASAEAELAFAPSRNLSADSAADAVAVYGHGFKEIEPRAEEIPVLRSRRIVARSP